MRNLPKTGRRDAARYSKEGWPSVFVFVGFLAMSGCKCADPKADAAAQREADLAVLPQASGSLQDQLAAEAANRPGQTATLEALTAALTKEGVAFNAPHQAYGKKLLAIYCASVDSADGMIITVCEYPSAEHALRGQAEASSVGKLLAGWQSRVSRKSVLQLVARSDTPPEHVAKVLSTFDGL
jgi:hypothetical protein